MNRTKLFLLSLVVCLPMLAAPRRVPISDAALITGLSSDPTSLTRVGAQVFFAANDGIHGTELWRTDGTTAGTRLVKDLIPGAQSSTISFPGTIGDALLVRNDADRTLWRSDGTAAGTYRLFQFPAPVAPSDGGHHVSVYAADTRAFVFVQQRYSTPDELWVVDGAADSARRIGTFDVNEYPLGANGKLYFTASDPTVGRQFWVSDGTLAGTHMLSRAQECPGHAICGPLPRQLFRIGTAMFFTTTTGVWRTDGTQQGTVEIAPTPDPGFIAATSTVAYFASGGKLWRTDGTSATQGPDLPQSPHTTRVLDDGRLVYTIGETFWRSDGQTATQLATVTSLTGYRSVGVIGKRLFFGVQQSETGNELWSIDADTGAVALVKDIDPRLLRDGAAKSNPGVGATLGTRLVFPAMDYRGTELWETDGTADGTKLVANIRTEANGGAVSGLVKDQDTSLPVPYAQVLICDTTCGTLYAGNDGRYRFDGVAAGTYRLSASSAYHLSARTDITVTAGFELQGVDLAVPRGGAITGKVTRASSGEPLYGAWVTIRNSGGTQVGRAFTAADGTYRSAPLTTGTYTLDAYPYSHEGIMSQVFRGVNCTFSCDSRVGEAVAVTMGSDTTAIDFPLRDYGRIRGTVTDPGTGEPLARATVDITSTNSPSSVGASVWTDDNGVYTTDFIVPGTYYVSAYHYDYEHLVHANIPCTTYPCNFANATQVPVTIDTTTSGIDFALSPKAARLTGVITGSDGAPLPNVRVQLWGANGSYAGGSDDTDAAGRYVITNVAAGTYHLRVHDEVVPNIDCYASPCDVSGATPVVLETRKSKRFDAQIRARSTIISGRVLDASGTPIATAGVAFFNSEKQPVSALTGSMQNGVYTYTLISRNTGFYVSALANGFKRTAYPNGRVTCTSSTCTLPATAVLLAAGTHQGIDITLPAYEKIRGKVTDATTGKPPQSVVVQFVSTNNGSPAGYAWTNDKGEYVFTEAEGSYYAYVSGGNDYNGQVWPSLNCSGSCVPSSGTAIAVPEGGEVTSIDFTITPKIASGAIAGRVVDHVTGAGLAGVYVSASSTDPYSSTTFTARTDAQGYYSIERASMHSPLKTGTYRLHAAASSPYFVSVYGGAHCASSNDCAYTGGATVQVNAPATTSGVDFRLIRLRITGVSPSSGPLSGGTTITISGTNFTPQTFVKIGDAAATIVSQTPTQIVARTPAGAAGHAHVTVYASPYLFNTLVHAFMYVSHAFTDESLAGMRVKALHIAELRDAINSLRASASLAPYAFSDPSLAGVRIRASHVMELRTALNQARAALSRPALTYANTLTAGTPIRAIDIQEIRAGVQ
jgi:ELWxxDGT repeat protein